MLQIGVLFFTALTTFTTAAPTQVNPDTVPVILDVTGCMNLECEFRGFGGDCKYPMKPFQVGIDSLRENESEADLFARVERMYPLNTFTIINHVDSAKVCGQYLLMCNALNTISYTQLIEYLKDPEAQLKPKFACGDNDQLIIPGFMDN